MIIYKGNKISEEILEKSNELYKEHVIQKLNKNNI